MKFSLFKKSADDDDDFDDSDLSDEEGGPSFFASLFKKRGAADSYEDDGDAADDGDGEEENDRRGWVLVAGIFLVVGVIGAAVGYYLVSGGDENRRIEAPPPPQIPGEAAGNTTVSMPMPPRRGPESPSSALLTPPGGNAANRRPWLKGTDMPPEAGAVSVPDTAKPPPPDDAAPASGGALPAPERPVSPSRIADPVSPPLEEGGKVPTFSSLPVPPKSEPLLPVHDPELSVKGPQGVLPVVTAQGKSSINTYARPFKGDVSKPRVSIVVAGLGLDRESTEAAIERLPADVTLAFSPYSPNVKSWIERARAAGHEALLELPMEPSGYPLRDPGPLGLSTLVSPQENAVRLDKVLGKGGAYVGVLATMGDRFLSSPSQILPILLSLRRRGLLYLDNGSAPGEGVFAGGAPSSLTYSVVDLTLDERPFAASIDARLATLVAAALGKGRAVGLASPYPVTLGRLIAWVGTLQAKGVELAPVSAVAITAAPDK
ncbi:MAG: divergent polysaccharide deacetylase family protein [Alphaproteobacteria bacterium]|nr:divergent polysaccharide deacetylase family protein [Alphaproteobacteria bacterium]